MTITPRDGNTSETKKSTVCLLSPTEWLGPEDVEALIEHAPYERIALWIRLLHDTGLDRRSVLGLQRVGLWKHGRIHYIVIFRKGVLHNIGCVAPIRASTCKALMRYYLDNCRGERIFPGSMAELGLEMALGIRLAALRAGLPGHVSPETFRRSKLERFREAGVAPDVVLNVMGGSAGELGLRRPLNRRARWHTLEEAAGVLDDEYGGSWWDGLTRRIGGMARRVLP